MYEAAQDVQRSADGSAYEQWVQPPQALHRRVHRDPHAVTCWYDRQRARLPART